MPTATVCYFLACADHRSSGVSPIYTRPFFPMFVARCSTVLPFIRLEFGRLDQCPVAVKDLSKWWLPLTYGDVSDLYSSKHLTPNELLVLFRNGRTLVFVNMHIRMNLELWRDVVKFICVRVFRAIPSASEFENGSFTSSLKPPELIRLSVHQRFGTLLPDSCERTLLQTHRRSSFPG